MSLRFKLSFVTATAALTMLVACTSGSGAGAPTQQEEPKAAAGAQQVEAQPLAAVGKPDAEGKVQINATADDFVPSRIEVEGGKPVTLVFTRTVEKSCMTKVVFPDLDIKEELPLDTPVEIEVTPKAGETIRFQCPMAMGKSVVVGLPEA